jgi:hypothetical protein
MSTCPGHITKYQSVNSADHQYHRTSLHLTFLTSNQRHVTAVCHVLNSLTRGGLLQYKQESKWQEHDSKSTNNCAVSKVLHLTLSYLVVSIKTNRQLPAMKSVR